MLIKPLVLINFFSFSIILVGLAGLFIYKKNLILLLISLEIFLLGINVNFILSSFLLDDLEGYIFNLFTLAVAGSEISIGLALTILFYRLKNNIFVDSITFLKS